MKLMNTVIDRTLRFLRATAYML